MSPVRRHARTRGYLCLITAAAVPLGMVIATAPARAATHGAARPRVRAAAGEEKGFFDAREGVSARQRAALAQRSARITAGKAVSGLRHSLGRQALVDIDPVTATPRTVARLDGALTGRSARPAAKIALDYVRTHASVFRLGAADLSRLTLRRDYVDIDGIHHLSWVQSAGGVEVFGNGLQANVARDGRLISVLGAPVPGLPTSAPAVKGLTGAAAVREARRDLGEKSLAPGSLDTARTVLFQSPGGLRRAWQTVTMSASAPALHVVDAETGRVLYRRSLVADANGKAHRYFPKAPRGGLQKPVDFTARGWLRAKATKLSGNNAHAYSDVNDDNAFSKSEEVGPRVAHTWDYKLVPFKANASFCGNPYPCSWNPDVPFSWRKNRKQNATQVFFFVNNFHDHLKAAPIGFTEAAGNFQKVNRSGKGLGGDAVLTETDDGANTDNGLPDANHIDNANMATPPDGTPPRMQMFLQHQPGTSYPDEDPFSPTNVGDEADTVYHEYTHGLSNRLVVDAFGNSTLGGIQAGAMGEAWSDWYAMDYLVKKGLQPDAPRSGDVVLFQYDGAGVALDRTQPIDCAVGTTAAACPGTDTAGTGGYTYGDYGKVAGFPEVHADGEIWAQTLWDLRRKLGSRLSEQLVTRAMELSPSNPSFLDERNSIIEADIAIHGGAHVTTIWKVFAKRGMGFFAGALNGDDAAPVEDFSMPPPATSVTGTLSGTVTDDATHAPIADAPVVFGGHASGFPGDLSAVTGPDGTYTIAGILPGTYPKVGVSAPGYDAQDATVTVAAGDTTHDFALARDWAAAAGGAVVAAFDGPDLSDFGCGPGGAIDQSLGSGWGSDANLMPAPDGIHTVVDPVATPKSITITLPKPVDITTIAVDPGATCGDGGSASTGPYKVETSTNGTTFVEAAAGVFTVADRGHLNHLTPAAGTGTGVTTVRFTMRAPQVFAAEVGGPDACPGAFSGCDFLDMSELEVYGS